MLDLTQLLRIPRLDAGFDISPDGTHVAFSWNKTGEWQIYELELDNPQNSLQRTQGSLSEFSAASSLTSGPGGKFNPRYAPDGTRLAYALDFDGSESYHLFTYNKITDEHTDLTPDISYALQPDFCWSPDGTQLAFLSNQHGHFSAYIMPATGGTPQLILDVGHPAWQVEWSPDGKGFAVCCEMQGQDYGIFIVDLQTKEVTEIKYNAHNPKWSPGGEKLVFHTDLRDEWIDVAAYDLQKEEISWLVKSPGDSESFAVMETTESYVELKSRRDKGEKDHALHVAYTKNDGAFNTIYTLEKYGPKQYQIGQGVHSGIKITPDLKRMVTTFSSPSQPPDLWMIDLESGQTTQLTNSMPVELSNTEFVMPEEIEYPGMDGVPVPALLFRPKTAPAPAVVMIHGGPNWHYSAEWNPLMAHLASRGYAVLAPNYRGSTGYGRDWQYAARFDLGGVDTRDVAAGAQHLIREGIADPRRIAVTGRSHGGYLTMTCLTQYPDLWCGGSAVVPFLNWFKSHVESREDLQHWNIENMGDPQENYEKWYNHSPYFFLDRVSAPVQLICGRNDPRCPASDSLDARDKLVELGKEVELLLYENEGHVFLNMDNVIHSEMMRVKFLMDVLET
ncbi:MAG TPA: alpha/beta fold hydrolase [Anaerolineales bacterium]|nr:alpha/beta fold hydrolase [Anaerolineales bacterium]